MHSIQSKIIEPREERNWKGYSQAPDPYVSTRSKWTNTTVSSHYSGFSNPISQSSLLKNRAGVGGVDNTLEILSRSTHIKNKKYRIFCPKDSRFSPSQGYDFNNHFQNLLCIADRNHTQSYIFIMQWQIFTITENLSKEILVMFYLEIIFSSHALKKKINRQPYFHFIPQFLVQGVSNI